ncbi:hypothetical protein [Bdellovibrio sp. HCB274]|uniref:hypothetical protein n=1 Tax=Bdellovibrio sp. HCB274 TaxID=3394361 RepID=UPI0039B54141
MKKLIVLFALIAASQSAFAGVYYTGECVAKTINGTEIRVEVAGRPTSPKHVQSEKLSSEESLATFDGNTQDENGNIFQLVMKQTNRVVTEQTEIKDEDCFNRERATDVTTAVVQKVSKKIQETLGLKKGQKLVFVCFNETTYGSGYYCQN